MLVLEIPFQVLDDLYQLEVIILYPGIPPATEICL